LFSKHVKLMRNDKDITLAKIFSYVVPFPIKKIIKKKKKKKTEIITSYVVLFIWFFFLNDFFFFRIMTI
jgi:hypothetical protein